MSAPPLRVAVGSTNAAKLRAVEMAVQRLFGRTHAHIEVHGYDVASGVAAQPTSAAETILGATNRARAALAASASASAATFSESTSTTSAAATADFAVGLEGGIERVDDQWFECGWFCVVDSHGRKGLGSSARFLVGESIAKRLLAGEELADVVKQYMHSDVRAGLGMMGVITDGHLPRAECYEQGLLFAFGPWVSAEHWWR